MKKQIGTLLGKPVTQHVKVGQNGEEENYQWNGKTYSYREEVEVSDGQKASYPFSVVDIFRRAMKHQCTPEEARLQLIAGHLLRVNHGLKRENELLRQAPDIEMLPMKVDRFLRKMCTALENSELWTFSQTIQDNERALGHFLKKVLLDVFIERRRQEKEENASAVTMEEYLSSHSGPNPDL